MRESKIKWLTVVFASCITLALVAAGSLVYHMYSTYLNAYRIPNDTLTREALGQLGDYFGGILNPILGVISVGLLVGTIYLSRSQVSDTRAQLQLSKDEYNRKQLEDVIHRQFEVHVKLLSTHVTGLTHKSIQCNNLNELLYFDKHSHTTISHNYTKAWRNEELKNNLDICEVFDEIEKNINRLVFSSIDIIKLTRIKTLREHWFYEIESRIDECYRLGILNSDITSHFKQLVMTSYLDSK